MADSAAYPPRRTAYVLATLITGAVMLFGLYAGIQLWRERRGAVTLARRFVVLVPLVPLAGSIPYAILPGFTVNLKAVAEGFLYTLIWAVLWYSYLRRSIRVENTFPAAFPASVRPPDSSPPPTRCPPIPGSGAACGITDRSAPLTWREVFPRYRRPWSKGPVLEGGQSGVQPLQCRGGSGNL
jgi:hypothetical protein